MRSLTRRISACPIALILAVPCVLAQKDQEKRLEDAGTDGGLGYERSTGKNAHCAALPLSLFLQISRSAIPILSGRETGRCSVVGSYTL